MKQLGAMAIAVVWAAMSTSAMATHKISPQHVKEYVRVLQLTDAQTETLMALYDACEASSKRDAARLERFSQKSQAIREDPTLGNREKMEQSRALMKETAKGLAVQQDSYKQFFEDVQLILDSEQLERWPLLERTRRRHVVQGRTMGEGSGVRVDLIEISTEIDIPAEAAEPIDELLEAYSGAYDRAITPLIRGVEDMDRQLREGGFAVAPGGEEGWEKHLAVLAQVRDVNYTHSDRIEQALRDISPGLAADWRRGVDELVHPVIFSKHRNINRMFDAAEKDSSLAIDQTEQIERLRSEWDEKAGRVNMRWAAEARENQRRGFLEQEEVYFGVERNGVAWAPPDDPEKAETLSKARELAAHRRSLDIEYQRKIRKILTDEQLLRLPKSREGRLSSW